MEAGQPVLPARTRVEHGAVIEAVRQRQPTLIARVGIEVGEHLDHSSELRVEHPLGLCVVKLGKDPFGPLGKSDLQLQRGPIARVAVRVAQPGKSLVQNVPGRPQTVQIEAAGANIAAGHLAHFLLAVGQRAQVPVPLSVLNLLKLLDDIVGPLFETDVARGRPHQAHRGQVVAGYVTREIPAATVPAAVGLRLGLEACPLPVVGQHSVGFEAKQILGVEVLGAPQRTAGQPYGRHWKRPGDRGYSCRWPG